MTQAYKDALATGSTTLCRCFRLTRQDGTVYGFTDHDEDVTFGGTIFRAGAALTASEAASTLGLSPDEMDAQGALSADAITEDDLGAGLYDGASVEVWDADWTDPAIRGLLGRFTVGEVERGALAFRAELRSLAASLDTQQGRMHTTLCDVRRFGDARCGLDLDAGGWRATGIVIRAEATDIWVSGLDAFASGFFDRGSIAWDSGQNAGGGADVRISRLTGTETRLSLWRDPARPVQAGDALTVTAGCNRTFAMCRDRFSNHLNFRGFPHMPGDEFAGEYAITGDPNLDGGSRFES